MRDAPSRRCSAGHQDHRHGLARLPAVEVCAYSAELRDADGFIGDRASRRAFREILQQWRERLPDGEDPIGDTPTAELSKKALDKVLAKGDPEAAGLVLGTVEEFARELATVASRLLRTPGWRGVQRIAVGGGMRGSRVGELAIGRASVLLKADGHAAELRPIHHHPDEAGLVGAAHLVPTAALAGFDALLAADIGGTNIRAGLVELNLDEAADLCAARVMGLDLWRHGDEAPGRKDAVARLIGMLAELMRRARKDGLRLAPVIGVACPGVIDADGRITRGGQNLPGNWQAGGFNLAHCLAEALPEVGGRPATVLIHNDAVVQGLSEHPWMTDVPRWGVLTIGTGLGNASFANIAGSAGTGEPG